MKTTKFLIIVLFITLAFGCNIFSKNKVSKIKEQNLDSMYHSAQRLYYSGNYNDALPLLKKYVSRSKKELHERERLFWVLSEIGRIYLRTKRDPDSTISYFSKLQKEFDFSQAEQDDIDAWIEAAKDWKKLGKPPEDIKTPDELYHLGERFYKAGILKNKYPMDEAGDADFHIAATYLIPFIVNNDSDKRIGQALLMMGEIRTHTMWKDKLYHVQNHYLGEVIRRFPHTDLAKKAYKILYDEVHFAYSGSSGDNTPPSWIRILAQYKKLQSSKKPKKKRPNTNK